MSKRVWCVYKTWKIDEPEKFYIGKTYREKHENGYMGSGLLIEKAIKKRGKEKYQSKILVVVSTDTEAYDIEEKLIERMDTYYNANGGGRGVGSGSSHPMYGRKQTEEAKRKMSINTSGKKNPMYGKKHSPETIEKIKQKRKLQGCSEETRKKLSDRQKGKKKPPFTEEHKKNISRAKLGHKVSDETRQKMSEAHRGKKLSNTHIKNRVSARKGYKHSEETKRKISEALLSYFTNHRGKNVK